MGSTPVSAHSYRTASLRDISRRSILSRYAGSRAWDAAGGDRMARTRRGITMENTLRPAFILRFNALSGPGSITYLPGKLSELVVIRTRICDKLPGDEIAFGPAGCRLEWGVAMSHYGDRIHPSCPLSGTGIEIPLRPLSSSDQGSGQAGYPLFHHSRPTPPEHFLHLTERCAPRHAGRFTSN